MAKRKQKKEVPLEYWSSISDINNAFKTLFANIRFASVDHKISSIVVVSAGVNEGKTMVSLNLANAIASSGQKVLIVEGDMRTNSVSKLLQIHPNFGILDILSGACTPQQACVKTNIENLYFLDSKNNVPSPPDTMSSSKFAALVDNLQETYEYVIFDTPPLGFFVDGAILANLADATIVAARQGKVKRSSLNEIKQQLETANAHILGTVLTFSTEVTEKDYYYAYYNQNHERVNKEDFEYKSDVDVQIAKKNLDSWLSQGSNGRAAKRRSKMTIEDNHADNTDDNINDNFALNKNDKDNYNQTTEEDIRKYITNNHNESQDGYHNVQYYNNKDNQEKDTQIDNTEDTHIHDYENNKHYYANQHQGKEDDIQYSNKNEYNGYEYVDRYTDDEYEYVDEDDEGYEYVDENNDYVYVDDEGYEYVDENDEYVYVDEDGYEYVDENDEYVYVDEDEYKHQDQEKKRKLKQLFNRAKHIK